MASPSGRLKLAPIESRRAEIGKVDRAKADVNGAATMYGIKLLPMTAARRTASLDAGDFAALFGSDVDNERPSSALMAEAKSESERVQSTALAKLVHGPINELLVPRDHDFKPSRRGLLAEHEKRLAELAALKAAERRKKWAARFEYIGDFYHRKLRHCNWRQSLRMAFEVPSLHSARFADTGHLIGKPQFFAAMRYAMVPNEKVLRPSDFDDFLEYCFDAFDLEGRGLIDYREFTCTLLFFRCPPETEPLMLIEQWFRYYDGDMNGGLSVADFLKMLVTLTVSPAEADGVLRLANLQCLEEAQYARKATFKIVGGKLVPIRRPGETELEASKRALMVTTEATRKRASTAQMVAQTREELTFHDAGPGGSGSGGPHSRAIGTRGSADYPFAQYDLDLWLLPRDGFAATAETLDMLLLMDAVGPEPPHQQQQQQQQHSPTAIAAAATAGGGNTTLTSVDVSGVMRQPDSVLSSISSVSSYDNGFSGASRASRALSAGKSRSEEAAEEFFGSQPEDMPWERGKGTLTEVRLFTASHSQRLRRAYMQTSRSSDGGPGGVPGDRHGADYSAVADFVSVRQRSKSANVWYNQRRHSLAVKDDPYLDPFRKKPRKMAPQHEPTSLATITQLSVTVPMVTMDMIHYFIQMSPGLLDEVHRLRLLRLPPVVRSSYLQMQLERQITQATLRYDRLREEVQTKRALTLYKLKQLRKYFNMFLRFVRWRIWRRVKVNSTLARRAVKRWLIHKRDRQVQLRQRLLAETHFLVHFMRKTFSGWKQYVRTERSLFAFHVAKAMEFRAFTLKHRYFHALRVRTQHIRAAKYAAARMVARCFRAWVQATNTWKEERYKTELAAQVAEERIKRTQEELARQDAERAAAEAAEAERIQYEAFLKEAEAAKERARLDKMREDAERKLRTKKQLEQLERWQEEAFIRRKEELHRSFEEEWDAKISAAVKEAREAALQFANETVQGKDLMRDDAKFLLMGETVEAVSQEGSDFVASFDMSDGCIHFRCEADPDAVPPRPKMDLNMDAMRLKDAVLVATAHYVGKKGCQKRDDLLAEKTKAWKKALQDYAGAVLVRAWRRRAERRAFLALLRGITEQLVDPHSGALYYLNTRTGRLLDHKPALFRDGDVHPVPDWYLKWMPHTEVTAEEVGAEEGAQVRQAQGYYIYAHRKIPWKTSTGPPPHYLICGVCNLEFATRRCVETGCDGLLYCWNCFSSYHPTEDEQWDSHWDSAVRVPVKPYREEDMTPEAIAAQVLQARKTSTAVSAFFAAARDAKKKSKRSKEKSAAEKAALLQKAMEKWGGTATEASAALYTATRTSFEAMDEEAGVGAGAPLKPGSLEAEAVAARMSLMLAGLERAPT